MYINSPSPTLDSAGQLDENLAIFFGDSGSVPCRLSPENPLEMPSRAVQPLRGVRGADISDRLLRRLEGGNGLGLVALVTGTD